MRETKILFINYIYATGRKLKDYNTPADSAYNVFLSDFPEAEADLDSYLAKGWTITNFITGPSNSLLILLTR